jgi:hypothetical protein
MEVRMNRKKTVTASFEFVEDLVKSIEYFKTNNREFITFSPIPNHAVEKALGQKKSRVGLFTLAGAITGLVSGFSLAVFTAAEWNLVLGGKPAVTLIPFVVIGFEFTILFGAIGTLIGLIINSKLPSYKKIKGYKHEFSVGHFGIAIQADEDEIPKLTEMLKLFGSKEVSHE